MTYESEEENSIWHQLFKSFLYRFEFYVSSYRPNVRPPRVVPLPRPLAAPLSDVGVLDDFVAGLSTKEVSVVIVISCAALRV